MKNKNFWMDQRLHRGALLAAVHDSDHRILEAHKHAEKKSHHISHTF